MYSKYEYNEEEPQMVGEMVMAYNSAVNQHPMMSFHVMEGSNFQKKDFLRNNLHFSTSQYLESQDWLEDKPFPAFDDPDDEAWIDEAEAQGTTDIVLDDIVNQDRLAWNSLR